MAQVRLSRADAEGGLPPLCMQCGAPADAEVPRSYSTDSAPLVPAPPPDLGPLGLLLLPLWLAIALIKLVSWSTARTMSVRTPLCRHHARGWFARSTLEAASITEDEIVLAGVSERFARAWDGQRAAGQSPAGVAVRLRCRACRALNGEATRFCDQCGTTI